VEANLDYVPPRSSNGSLYIRPFVIGSGPQIGLSPAPEFSFMILVNPVGDYYKGGMGSPVKAIIARNLDRAAPNGTGHVKLAGNYAPVFGSTSAAKEKGYTVNLFLDAKEGRYVEEFATSNFAAVKRSEGGEITYVTPRSDSILPGVTNRSLAELASRLLGWKVERRVVEWEEVKRGDFSEVVAAGTAVVMTPVGEIHRELPLQLKAGINKKSAVSSTEPYDWEKDEVVFSESDYEPTSLEKVVLGEAEQFKILYKNYRDLQTGDLAGWEKYNWMWPAEGI
jgi:branched-chain amino acid aminotransferase